MTIQKEPIFCIIYRASGNTPVSERAVERPCERMKFDHTKLVYVPIQGTFWGISFESAEDFLSWIHSQKEKIIINAFEADNFKVLDRLPLPTFELTIYDDYIE